MAISKLLVIMVGCSGSGKSTFARNSINNVNIYRDVGISNSEAYLVETDAIRAMITGDASDQSKNGEVFDRARRFVNEYLSDYPDDETYITRVVVFVDATNLTPRDRAEFVAIGKKHNAEVMAYVFKTPIAVCKARNAARDRKVPEHVIDRQFAKFVDPTKDEGFDNIIYVDTNGGVQ